MKKTNWFMHFMLYCNVILHWYNTLSAAAEKKPKPQIVRNQPLMPALIIDAKKLCQHNYIYQLIGYWWTMVVQLSLTSLRRLLVLYLRLLLTNETRWTLFPIIIYIHCTTYSIVCIVFAANLSFPTVYGFEVRACSHDGGKNTVVLAKREESRRKAIQCTHGICKLS